MFKYKQAILVRRDLKLSKGKLSVEVAHASVAASNKCRKMNPKTFKAWMEEGGKKVVLEVRDEKELIDYFERAKSLKLHACLIEDAGLTEVRKGTKTTVGIGPALEEEIDRATGELKLL
ncbi:MAG: peptidyl-tRNA hydrolase Pth2 [Candidatus Methanofastidiosia archaeon]